MKLFDVLKHPWPWPVAGVLIGLTVPVLLLLGNKKFGISSTLRQICAACIPAKIPFFQYDWRKDAWNLYFVAGITIGGLLSRFFLSDPDATIINPATVTDLKALGITSFHDLMPYDLFSWSQLFTIRGFICMVAGGFLVGFGTRYAGGCTSGHSIMGLSDLQWPSLVATVCFMAGGIIMTHFILPFLLLL
jgi:uncharacterized membrane protein YedE/YeeE